MKELLKDYSDPPEPPVYAVGDTGPAGGIVFYDKGFYSAGWRYLEAAPADIGSIFVWGTGGYATTSIPGTSTAIGSGAANTDVIFNAAGTDAPAAYACHEYTYGGQSDWFLPSQDELNLMYINQGSIGGFGSGDYWSSSENSFVGAWRQRFSDGYQYFGTKNSTGSVRAVRAF
jgi:hypothetical protein